MQVGMQIVYQNKSIIPTPRCSAQRQSSPSKRKQWASTSLGLVEHHFTKTTPCPGQCGGLGVHRRKDKKLGSCRPPSFCRWNDPLRVAEKAALLDILSEGRVILDLGGLAKREFDGRVST